jgi:preprotein translocase subunit SecG
MTIVLTIIHIVVSLLLILIVLAQQGKGQDLASAFGGGGSSAAFGARGTATLLSKITTVAAVIFMLTSLGLTYFRPTMSGGTVVPDTPAPEVQQPEAGPGDVPPPAEGEAPAGDEQPPGEGTEAGQEPQDQDTQGEDAPPAKKKQ